jgi:predicted alpha/beta-hydrolase family hydrolase
MTALKPEPHRFEVAGAGEVSALLLRPSEARWLYVFAHGAGAGMKHRGMADIAQTLADRGVATLRYNFPYMEKGGGPPNPKPIIERAVRAAISYASALVPDLPLLAGGKSFGGRMTSLAASHAVLEDVHGLVFFGFPLHPANCPGLTRAEHLASVTVPMLFLQGSQDALADLSLLKPVCETLGELATLHVIPDADHSFHVPRKSGRTDTAVLQEAAEVVLTWSERLMPHRNPK